MKIRNTSSYRSVHTLDTFLYAPFDSVLLFDFVRILLLLVAGWSVRLFFFIQFGYVKQFEMWCVAQIFASMGWRRRKINETVRLNVRTCVRIWFHFLRFAFDRFAKWRKKRMKYAMNKQHSRQSLLRSLDLIDYTAVMDAETAIIKPPETWRNERQNWNEITKFSSPRVIESNDESMKINAKNIVSFLSLFVLHDTTKCRNGRWNWTNRRCEGKESLIWTQQTTQDINQLLKTSYTFSFSFFSFYFVRF